MNKKNKKNKKQYTALTGTEFLGDKSVVLYFLNDLGTGPNNLRPY